MRFRWLLILTVLLCAELARAGVVRTLDGKMLEGEIRLEDGLVMIVPKSGPLLRVPTDNLIRITIAPAAALSQGLVLVDGTVLSVDRFISADNLSVKFARGRGDTTLPVDSISRLVFSPVGLGPVHAGATGVILPNKDFFEGDFQWLRGGKVAVSSVLFGLKEMAVRSEVSAVVLRPAGKLPAGNIVRLRDGTEMATKTLIVRKAGVETDERLFGLDELAEIRCAGAAQSLADLIDDSAENVLENATPADVPASLLGATGERAVSLLAGKSLTIRLDGAFRTFAATAGVAQMIAPALRVGLIVSGDGKELARLVPKSSIDDPGVLAVNVTGVQKLTLLAISETPALPGFIVLLDPLFIKNR